MIRPQAGNLIHLIIVIELVSAFLFDNWLLADQDTELTQNHNSIQGSLYGGLPPVQRERGREAQVPIWGLSTESMIPGRLPAWW